MILNTQTAEAPFNGFNLFKSMDRQKTVGRLAVPMAQVIDLNLEQEVMIDSFRLNSGGDAADGLSNQTNPSFTDISAMPTGSSSPTASSFLDYIHNGWLLDFMIAIDFTSSNGKQ